jgi:hypothetical protein
MCERPFDLNFGEVTRPRTVNQKKGSYTLLGADDLDFGKETLREHAEK